MSLHLPSTVDAMQLQFSTIPLQRLKGTRTRTKLKKALLEKLKYECTSFVHPNQSKLIEAFYSSLLKSKQGLK
jgi:hypothetical protein